MRGLSPLDGPDLLAHRQDFLMGAVSGAKPWFSPLPSPLETSSFGIPLSPVPCRGVPEEPVLRSDVSWQMIEAAFLP